jgi:hypothetical protein
MFWSAIPFGKYGGEALPEMILRNTASGRFRCHYFDGHKRSDAKDSQQ